MAAVPGSTEASVVWAPVVAALGAAFLTGLVAFGLDWRRARHAKREAILAAQQAAYGGLLSISGLITHTAGMLHVVVETRSGLREGLDVATRVRKPVDPIHLLDMLRRDLEPLYEAWSSVWLVGSQQAVQVSNAVVERSARVIGAATSRSPSTSRLRRFIVGERWTKAEMDAFQADVEELAKARRRLAQLARKEFGVEAAELFYDAELEAKALGGQG